MYTNQSSSPRTSSHNTTGTTTLSLHPVRIASVALVPPAASTALTIAHVHENGPSWSLTGHRPTANQIRADINPQNTATANATLPSRDFPPPQNHFTLPNRRPISDAAASPIPTQMTPLTILTSRESTPHPIHGPSPVRGISARDSQSGIEHPIKRKMCETMTGPRWSRPST